MDPTREMHRLSTPSECAMLRTSPLCTNQAESRVSWRSTSSMVNSRFACPTSSTTFGGGGASAAACIISPKFLALTSNHKP